MFPFWGAQVTWKGLFPSNFAWSGRGKQQYSPIAPGMALPVRHGFAAAPSHPSLLRPYGSQKAVWRRPRFTASQLQQASL